jgi:peptidoglycan/LPS O-acetylase OafA/YrhL
MKKGTSLYLDLIRFSAALMVFSEHFRERTKHAFYQLWNDHPFLYKHLFLYSQTAVIVFFVLSGFVIAHVLATRERTPLKFTASRFGRLYSVVIPTLILMTATNYLIALRYPHAFDAYGDGASVSLEYLRTSLFVSNFWLWQQLDVANGPFWSLSLEVAYYVGIALLVFTKGRARVLSLVVLCLAAGPTMVLLAPTWLLGYAAYHLTQRRRLHAGAAFLIWLASAILLMLCPVIELHMREPLPFLRMPDQHLGALLASYAAAICFAANIITFNHFSDRVESLFVPFASLIRWLGSTTFALYMFHMSILAFLTVYPVGGSGSLAQFIAMTGGTFLIVVTIGRFCEQSKGSYRRFFLWLWGKLNHKASPPAYIGPSTAD